MHYVKLNQPTNEMMRAINLKAFELVQQPSDIKTVLDLYHALSIYKLTPEVSALHFEPDRVQINLFKDKDSYGIRLFMVGSFSDTARIFAK